MKTKLAGMGGATQTFVDDVFSTWLYTGNGSTQTITNGIDLAGKGGLVWIKDRDPNANYDHKLIDTDRGVGKPLSSNATWAQLTENGLTAFNSTGFNVALANSNYNVNAIPFVSWTFRKAAKFFDVVTYTGNGASNRAINHSLGIAPGMIVVKKYAQGSGVPDPENWYVYNISRGITKNLYLNTTSAEVSGTNIWDATPTSSTFTIGGGGGVNSSGCLYVAYLFAHDTASDGIIQCGSYTGTGAAGLAVTLGYEPQWVMIKDSNAVTNWEIMDNMRGFVSGSGTNSLRANTSAAENTFSDYAQPTATGFTVSASSSVNFSGRTYIYMAIRMPNKPPTSGTQVFSPITSSGATGTALTTGFSLDLQIAHYRILTFGTVWADRLRGVISTPTTATSPTLISSDTSAETTSLYATRYWNNTGFEDPAGWSGNSVAFWNFKRAPGFMDVVCYTYINSTTPVYHNLGIIPELVIIKQRNSISNWPVWTSQGGGYGKTGFMLNGTEPWVDSDGVAANSSAIYPFYIRHAGGSTTPGSNVAYLFATLAGISKVGSYTGNGGTQNIDCGFAAGARFILIKRTDSTGDWFVWDTARGIVAANDPHLSLNTTAAEVTTDDSIDPLNAGFTVNQVAATNINVSSATYIYLAIA